ncbi:MAG: lamin tail domain-containing protein [Saprospiraceae bacterium]|nr:lamin tail domain-containing protein [Saprospiraceae bacterium]
MVTSPTNAIAGYLEKEVNGYPLKVNDHLLLANAHKNCSSCKINEVRFKNSLNSTDQFIELYNGSDKEVDLSGWSLVNTKSEWAPVELATIPKGKKLKPKAFYLLGLSPAGLATPPGKA